MSKLVLLVCSLIAIFSLSQAKLVSTSEDEICSTCTESDRHANDPSMACFKQFPDDITKYYVCDAEGRSTVMSCADGLYWEQSELTCMLLGNPCSTCTDENRHDGDPENVCFLPFPDDIHQYVMCDLQGNAFVRPCPAGMMWSEEELTCVRE